MTLVCMSTWKALVWSDHIRLRGCSLGLLRSRLHRTGEQTSSVAAGWDPGWVKVSYYNAGQESLLWSMRSWLAKDVPSGVPGSAKLASALR